ncbi:hypothetical protein ANANG_G00181310 [Anguilla anguilla]|uniref:Uncharacterized protein n=1 Tax=Anguilla anguilla TaxID=7936 RepID=A0A9D3RTE1_ANGAN|nr:hypothetical protein ANANG_G00181310 [Anguilla anguilla]
MTTHESCMDSFLSDEEDARAIEDAIKAAIKAVMYVLCNINNNKIRAYEMMVAQRDRENERLRMQMKSAEMELISLRRYRRTMGQGGLVDSVCSLDSGISSEENSKQDLCAKSGSCDAEEDMRGQPLWSKEFATECTGPCASAADQAEREGWGTTVDPSLVAFGEGLRCRSRGEWTNGGPLKSDGDSGHPAAAAEGPVPVKEEPPDFETVCVKWEVCDRGVPVGGGARPAPKNGTASTWSRDGAPPCGERQNHSCGFPGLPGERTTLPPACQKSACSVWPDLEMKRMSNREKLQRYRARIRADPDKYRVYREMDRRRYQMRKKSIKDLPEHCQKLKREAWREAARRHRARKKSCPPIGPHVDLALNVEVPLDPTEILQSWDPTICTGQGNQVPLD